MSGNVEFVSYIRAPDVQ